MIVDHHAHRRDNGTIMPFVLLFIVLISVIVVALANYVTTSLKYGNIVEERADRLASADGGLRYGVEQVRSTALNICMTNLGVTGYTIDFPATLNDAPVQLTCRKNNSTIGDIKSWAVIVTGEGVPSTEWMLGTQGAANTRKYVSGPVWITDPQRSNLQAEFEVEDGNVWYHRTDCSTPLTLSPVFFISPATRGTICIDQPWDAVFIAPPVGAFPPVTDIANTNPAPTMNGSCKVFRPGRYTVKPLLGANNYFQSGNYYFENVYFDVQAASVTAGWPDFAQYGDIQFIPNTPCDNALNADRISGSLPGATFYLGGTSKFEVGSQGTLEIHRRLQGNSLVSVQTIDTTTANQLVNTLGYLQKGLYTTSGNNKDTVIHGLFWAPRAQLDFGNVTNVANGMLLGGAVGARVQLQASGSANKFVIRVENSPIPARLRIDSTATKNGQSTTMRAIVVADDNGNTALESVRVVD